MRDVLLFLGVSFVNFGLAVIYWPAALIFSGVVLMGLSYLLALDANRRLRQIEQSKQAVANRTKETQTK